ncbi:MAG: hypothetical protein AB7S26_00405 [Sandaracinaceae bacterium]
MLSLVVALAAANAAAQPSAPEEALLTPASGAATRGGAAVAIDGDLALVGVPGTGTAATHGTVYAYRRTAPATWTLEQTIVDPEPAATNSGDTFGASVALSGATAVVGDPTHASRAGQAWVLTRDAGSGMWSAVAVLPPAGAPTRFGTAVAIAPPYVLVGAPDSGGGRAGAVVVFDLLGGLDAAQIATPADVTGAGLFGAAVAISAPPADTSTVIVGAPGSDRAYAFALPDGDPAWSSGTSFAATSSGRFGAAVALSPDGRVAVIGAHEESGRGAAYVLRRDTASGPWPDLGAATQLGGSDSASSDHFGSSVAAIDDVVVVGSPYRDASSADTGALYLFQRVDDAWREVSRYATSAPMTGDQLGVAVALTADSVLGGAPRPASTLGYAAVFPFPSELGEACELDARCASGLCVDGVCCNEPCGGGSVEDCVACSVATGASEDGTCGATREAMSCVGCGGEGTCGEGVCSASLGCDAGGADDAGAPPPHRVSGCKCGVAVPAGSRWGLEAGLMSALAWVAFQIRSRRARR